jgi:ankyrin repeat protein
VVKYLVEKGGANVHAYEEEALHLASCNGHLDVARYLVQNGANVHALNDDALRCAIQCGHLEVVRYLVECGANAHAVDERAPQFASRQFSICSFVRFNRKES